jgi:signal transduction histidine kinase
VHTIAAVTRALRAAPLFAALPVAELETLAALGEMRRVGTGATLFHQGDTADRLFVVLQGTLIVWVRDPSGAELELASIGPGEYVGEVALVDGGPRSASVTARTPAELFVLARSAFLELLQSHAGALSSVLETLTRTVRASDEQLLRQELERRVVLADLELARHRALTQLVAGIAHELNTPLGIARTAASVVRQRIASGALRAAEADAEARAALTDIEDAARLIDRHIERAHRLVEQFKKLSSSQLSDTLETLDLGSAVVEVVELFSISARQARLNIVVHDRLGHDPAARAWVGYRGCLSQVLLNLLTNVQRYAYPEGVGGDVEIVLAHDEARQAQGFVVSVRDSGRGIPDDDLPRVFDPFFTTGRDKGGSGLGLAIVRSLVSDGLGGSIGLVSRVGEGTTVTIRLPRSSGR